MIRCLARHFGSPGGADKAVRVARCESGLNEKASDGTHFGLYQFRDWPAWSQSYYGRLRPWGHPRTNAKVAVLAARKYGTWTQAWPVCGYE